MAVLLLIGTRKGLFLIRGSGNGQVTEAARHLPPILSVEAAAWP